MRLPQRSYRLIAPVFVGLQALVLMSCEASRTLDPLSADDLTPSAQRNGRRAFALTISAPDSSLTPNQQVQATAVVKDNRGRVISASRVAWAVDSDEIAAVSSTGLVTGGNETGSTTISATMDGVTGTMQVSVAPNEESDTPAHGTEGDTTSTEPGTEDGDSTSTSPDSVTSSEGGAAAHMVSITANATTLEIGEVTQVSGVVRDASGAPIADVPISWSTSPTTVATIASTSTSAGTLTARGVGTATIYAKADTVVRSITITVKDSATEDVVYSAGADRRRDGWLVRLRHGGRAAPHDCEHRVPGRQPADPRAAGANLQAAIDAAQAGDELLSRPARSTAATSISATRGR
jgi:hypothetical protein